MEVYQFMQDMKAHTTIPFETQQAFRERFSDLLGFSLSATAATAHDVSVNEAGISTYTVMDNPNAFLRLTTNTGTAYDVPAFTV